MKATATRRESARKLDRHPDSVTRLLPEGLGYAVLAWGGRGKEMTFDPALVERWRLARDCSLRRPDCSRCRVVLEDAEAVALHLIRWRHGHGGCAECRPPKALEQPCALPALPERLDRKRLVTRVELAASLGVHPVTILLWETQGMPVAEQGA